MTCAVCIYSSSWLIKEEASVFRSHPNIESLKNKWKSIALYSDMRCRLSFVLVYPYTCDDIKRLNLCSTSTIEELCWDEF